MASKHTVDVPARVPYGFAEREPWLELDFPISEFERRVVAVQAALEASELDALMVYGDHHLQSNVRYLSGFFGLFGQSWVVVGRSGEAILVTNAVFHGEPMHSNVQTTYLRDIRPLPHPTSTGTRLTLVEFALKAVEEVAGGGRIGIADLDVPAPVYTDLQTGLKERLVPAPQILRTLRRIKSPAEIEKIRELARIATVTMEAAIAATRPSTTENEIAAAAYQAAFAAGAERMSAFMAVAGKRSFMKNVLPLTGKKVLADELVEFDMNLHLAGYVADHARNTVAGQPTGELRPLLELSLEAHRAGLEATKPGATVNDVMNAMHDAIATGGWAEWDWSTGHGFGLDLAEDPMFVPQNDEPLEPGMCFYLEPMIVPSEIGTVCPEDMILVTETGCEQLTTTPLRSW
jgi:Xaa-Pro aminopeptidase